MVEVNVANGEVMFARMSLGKEVCKVIESGLPFYFEMSLSNAISDPMESHVDGLASLLFYSVIGDGYSTLVITDDPCWRLLVAEFFEGGAEGFAFFGSVEQSSIFCFGSRRDFDINDGAELS